MNFCLCGNSRCICKTFCICIHRGCLCRECHDLRKKDRCKECGLSSPTKDLAQSASDISTCKCEFFSRLQAPSQEIYSPGSSHYVAKESSEESESSVPKAEPRTKGLLQVSSNQTLIPIEQEVEPIQDIGGDKSHLPAMCLSEKQVYKSITFFKEHSSFSTDDSESSSEEVPVAKEAFDYFSPSSRHQQPKNNQSVSEKLSSDISSACERVEIPSSRSSSGISILEMPENECGSVSQTEPQFSGSPLVVISSVKIFPNEIGNLCLQRPESTTPTMILGEGTRDNASLGRSVSPIEIITTNPRTVLVSSSGELHLLSSRNLQSIRHQAPTSNAIHAPQSVNSDKASSDSTVKVSTDILPSNIQSSENPQIESREKLTQASRTCNKPE